MKWSVTFLCCLGVLTASAQAATTVKMYLFSDASQKAKYIGTVTAKQTQHGLLLIPDLKTLPPGGHGFHIHQYPSCKNTGQAAGAHLDPKKTNKHLGPYDDNGHLGDLPVLYVNESGVANIPVLAPKLHISDLQGRAVMIHQGADNYSDAPMTLGGSGTRIACGVASFKLS